MGRFLKKAKTAEDRKIDDRATRDTVEAILNEIESRGVDAVHEYSRQFDKWDPDSFVLSEDEIQECIAQVCLLYTSPSPRDQRGSRMPSSA